MNYVFHEAALGSVPRSVADPLTTNDVNITGTLNMLLAARQARVKRFVYASSSSVYGDSPVLPKVETMPVEPMSPYALSKYAGEAYTRLFFKLYGLETIALRYFNVFGPRQAPDSQYAAVIPVFVSKLMKGEAPVIYGDGNQSRDFSYVEDVVEANLLACSADPSACGDVYNLAYHSQITINALFDEIKRLVSRERKNTGGIKPLYQPARAGDVRESLADIAKITAKLKFRPRFSLKTGLEKTVAVFLGGQEMHAAV